MAAKLNHFVGSFVDDAAVNAYLTAHSWTAEEGWIYYNSTATELRWWDGSAWVGPGGAATDPNAIHVNAAAEISGIAPKAAPIAADLIVIEDSGAANAKKSAQVGNLPVPSHALGTAHSADTLANLNAKVSDATLDDSSATRTPASHAASHGSAGGDSVKLDDLATPDDNTDLDSTVTEHGLLPKLGGGAVNYLRADGTWVTPPNQTHALGGGDHSVDTLANLNAKVSDANMDDLSAARTPSSHAASHGAAGGDSVKLDDLATPDDNTDLDSTVTEHGLLLKLGGGTVNYLRADGTWSPPPGGADPNAIHVNAAAEISGIAPKAVPIAADLIVIEDSAAGNAKKSVQIGNLPGGAGGASAGSYIDIGGPYQYTQPAVPVEETMGDGTFDGSLVSTLTAYFRASVTNVWTTTGTTRVRLYDMGPAAGPPGVPRLVTELTATAQGGPREVTQALSVVAAAPGTDDILNTARMYEVVVIQDSSTIGDSAYLSGGLDVR